MKRYFTAILIAIGFLMGTIPSASAQFFGISADGAIAYSASERGVNGMTVGIVHPIPFVPNLGGTGFYFERRDKGAPLGDDRFILHSKNHVRMVNLYYTIPIPIFSLDVGVGAGGATFETEILNNAGQKLEKVEVVSPAGAGFVRFGLPFFHVLDFHLGYHYVSIPEVDLTDKADTEVEGLKTKVDFSGSLTTVGMQIAF